MSNNYVAVYYTTTPRKGQKETYWCNLRDYKLELKGTRMGGETLYQTKGSNFILKIYDQYFLLDKEEYVPWLLANGYEHHVSEEMKTESYEIK